MINAAANNPALDFYTGRSVGQLIQVQAFNASNHTNFANPAAAQTQLYNVSGAASRTAGVLTGPAATSGCQLQFALKLIF